jgi:hypothetical protein
MPTSRWTSSIRFALAGAVSSPGAERLVEQEHLGLVHDGAPRPLADAAHRKVGGVFAVQPGQPHHVECGPGPAPPFRLRYLADFEPVLDVLDDARVREPMVLKSVFYVTRVRWPPRYIDATELDGTAVRSIKPGDQPKSCRLAGARGTQQGEKLAPADLEVHAGHRHRRAVRLAHRD